MCDARHGLGEKVTGSGEREGEIQRLTRRYIERQKIETKKSRERTREK